MENLRKRTYEIIEIAQDNDIISKIFDIFIISLIVLNVAAIIIESCSDLPPRFMSGLKNFELVSVNIFTIEYILSLWTAKYLYPDSPVPMLRYIFSFMAMIDLFAILPFYIPMVFPVDLRFIRILRLFRIMRVLKLTRYNAAMETIVRIMKNEKDKLLYTIFIMGILIIFDSALMYYVENPVQPDKFPNILASIWWSVTTLTTVGYGDIYPITPLGKLLCGVITILGIVIIALPTGIISSGFIAELNNQKKTIICPHCGKEIEVKK